LVYLTNNASKKEIHSKITRAQQFIPLGTSPNYAFEFGDVQLFQKQLEDTIDEEKFEHRTKF